MATQSNKSDTAATPTEANANAAVLPKPVRRVARAATTATAAKAAATATVKTPAKTAPKKAVSTRSTAAKKPATIACAGTNRVE